MVVHLFDRLFDRQVRSHRNRRTGLRAARAARPAAEPLEPRAYLSATGTTASAAAVTNVGSLSFAAPIQVVTGPGVVAATVGDFNGDGEADLAILSEGGFTNTGNTATSLAPAAPTGNAVISVLLGRGDGTFQPPLNTLISLSNLTNLSGAGGPVFLGQPAAGDFNGDGRQDLAFAVQGTLANTSTFASGGAVIALPGNGDGTFGSPQLVSNTPGIPLNNGANGTNFTNGTTLTNAGATVGATSAGTFFTPAGAGVVSIGSTNGIAFLPSGTASGFVVTSPGVGIPGSGTIGLGTFGSGNVFGGPVDNGGASFGDANGAFVATGLPTPAGGSAVGVMLGSASNPVVTGGTFATQTTLTTLGNPTGNFSTLGNLPTFNQTTFPTSLGNVPTFNSTAAFNSPAAVNATGINTLNQTRQPVGIPLVTDTGTVSLATQGATGETPIVPTGAVASTSGGTLVLLQPVNFGAAGTLAGVPGFTSFPGGVPIGFSPSGPFVVTGDFNDDGRPDLAVFTPSADTVSILLNTTASARKSAALASLGRPKAAGAAGAVQFIPAVTDAPAALSPGATKATVTVSLTNQGSTTAAAPVTLQLFASPDQAVEPGQAALVTVTKKLRLKAHQSKSIKLKLGKFPALADGPYYVLAQVTEPDGSVAVAPSANPVTVSAPVVDLAAGFTGTPPASLRQGKPAAVAVKVTNAGTAAAAGTVSVDLTASPSLSATPGPISLATASVKLRLAAGASKVVKLKFKPSTALTAGTPYFFVAKVSSGGAFTDANATNDVAVSATPFTLS